MPAAAVLVISLVGAAVSAAGSMQAGKAQQEAAEYNAQVAERDAQAAQDKAIYDEQMHRERARKVLSTQKALYGISGVDTEGSPLLVMEDSARQAEMDAKAIRYGGDVAAARHRSEAVLSRMQGKNAKTASYYQAGSTLLQGASSGISGYYGMTK